MTLYDGLPAPLCCELGLGRAPRGGRNLGAHRRSSRSEVHRKPYTLVHAKSLCRSWASPQKANGSAQSTKRSPSGA